MTAAIYDISEYRAKLRPEPKKDKQETTGVAWRLDDGRLVSFPLQTSQQEPG